jgi:hypothetical protein
MRSNRRVSCSRRPPCPAGSAAHQLGPRTTRAGSPLRATCDASSGQKRFRSPWNDCGGDPPLRAHRTRGVREPRSDSHRHQGEHAGARHHRLRGRARRGPVAHCYCYRGTVPTRATNSRAGTRTPTRLGAAGAPRPRPRWRCRSLADGACQPTALDGRLRAASATVECSTDESRAATWVWI